MPLSTVKGAVVLAALRYIEARCREADLKEARERVRDVCGEGVVLASQWYPRDLLHSFEDVAQRCSRASAPFTKRAFGGHLFQALLTGTYSNLRKDTPRGMAAALPLLFSCVYTDLRCKSRWDGAGRCTFEVDGVGLLSRDQEVHAGGIEGAVALAGAQDVTLEMIPCFNGNPLTVVLRWGAAPLTACSEKVLVKGEYEIIESRDKARRIATAMGFGTVDVVGLATCISELARNIVNYAGEGTILIEDTLRQGARCFRIRAQDQGPGIPNLDEVMSGNFRSEKGLGMGLLAIKKLSDEFTVDSQPDRGTTIEVIKYLGRRS